MNELLRIMQESNTLDGVWYGPNSKNYKTNLGDMDHQIQLEVDHHHPIGLIGVWTSEGVEMMEEVGEDDGRGKGDSTIVNSQDTTTVVDITIEVDTTMIEVEVNEMVGEDAMEIIQTAGEAGK